MPFPIGGVERDRHWVGERDAGASPDLKLRSTRAAGTWRSQMLPLPRSDGSDSDVPPVRSR
jgi:hypothetical protein